MINSLFIFAVALFMVVKGATMATKYAARLAEGFRLSKYTTGFIIVAVISILPETFVAINSALNGVPSFGLGTLLGSNVADLTLVFVVIIFYTGRSLKVEGKILKSHAVYPFILLLPLVLGLNGNFSRMEGLALIIAGGLFYYFTFKKDDNNVVSPSADRSGYKSFFMLVLSMGLLLTGSHFTVTSALGLAGYLGVDSILIGMLIVGLGTTIPELFFSLRSIEKKDDALAVGDILGTVLADATIVVGILALINPFSFPQRIIYITGIFMVAASFVLFDFMRTGRNITRKEARMLLAFWVVFALVEFAVNKL